MKIKITVSIGLVGCRREKVIEVDDDMTDEEIDEYAKEVMFESELVSWHWSKQS